MSDLVPQWDQLPDLSFKEKVSYLTYQFLKFPQVDCPIKHLIGNGMYIREMKIPAGTLFLGRAHRRGHECQLIKGSVVYITEVGKRVVSAPFIVHTSPGTHMALYALTDVIGRTVHPNKENSVDTDALEAQIFDSVDSMKQLGAQIEYRFMLQSHGIDESALTALIEDESDQVPFPEGWGQSVAVGDSPIHGKGLLATQQIRAGEIIVPAKVAGMRTPAGRYTNHAFDPNALMIPDMSGNVSLHALKGIASGQEITIDYRHALKIGVRP